MPAILYSNQGREYLSHKHQELCERIEITLSASTKASPWQNRFMERFFGTLKDEFPPLNQLRPTEQLCEATTLTMHHYNYQRRHTALDNLSPAAYAAILQAATPLCKRRDGVLQKSGAWHYDMDRSRTRRTKQTVTQYLDKDIDNILSLFRTPYLDVFSVSLGFSRKLMIVS